MPSDLRRYGDIVFNENARVAAVAKAAEWTRKQAERLGVKPAAINASILLGNLPPDIEAMTSRHELALSPAEAVVRKIAAAEVRPIRLSRREAWNHDRFVSRPRAA